MKQETTDLAKIANASIEPETRANVSTLNIEWESGSVFKKRELNYKTEAAFQRDLQAGKISKYTTVFIKDSKKIYKNGTYYGAGSGGSSGGESFDPNTSQLTGFTESTLTNNQLEIQPTDSVNTAFGKLQKAVKDDEEVLSAALTKLKTSIGLTENLDCEFINQTILDSKSITEAIEKIADKSESKQEALVSGTNIKTINGESLLGSGDIQIQSGGVGKVDPNSGNTGEIFNNYNKNKASGNFSHAEGYMTTASGNRSHAEGSDTTASGSKSHAEGQSTIADGEASHAEGYATKAEYTGSHSEGYYTIANGRGAHAEGESTIAKNVASHAEGQNTITLDSGHSEGGNTLSLGIYAHAEGRGNTQKTICRVTEAVDDYIIIDTKVSGISNNYFLIYPNVADIYLITKVEYPTNNTTKITYVLTSSSSGSGNKVEANNNERTFIFYRQGMAIGDYSHSEGGYTIAFGHSSHSEGYGTKAPGQSGHAEGSYTNASGAYSHAEGDSTNAIGSASHAEGFYTYANGNYSHSEGNTTKADGDYSHSEGIETNATGQASHAEGKGSVAFGDQSHAAGFQSIAVGNYAMALGGGAIAYTPGSSTTSEELLQKYDEHWTNDLDSIHVAYGKGSMITGKNNLAIGNYSYAGGYGNVSICDYQYTVGTFNSYSSSDSDKLFVIGNGTSNDSRSNAFVVTTTGVSNSSDIKLKENIKDLTPKGNLRLVEFDWKRTGKHSYGFIAQEVEQIYPEMVLTDGDYKMVNYNEALCAMIAELEHRIKQLEENNK